MRVWKFGLALLTVAGAWGQTPSISGVVNATSFLSGPVAPGEELSIFGSSLASTTVSNCASAGSFPTTCGGISITIGNLSCPLVYVSATQINLYAPPGLAGGSANLVITTASAPSAPFALTEAPASPAIAAFTDASGTEISSSHLAAPGQVVEGYLEGLGISNGTQLAANIGVTVGGIPAQILFAGLVTGLYQLGQINFTVPAGLLGNQPVVVTTDGIASPPVTLALTAGTPASISIATGSNLGTFSLGEVQIGLNATGGTGSYTWSVASGSSLPPGLALRGDLPAYLTPSAPEGLIGVATTAGSYNFSLQVTSGSSSVTQSFSLKITPLALKDGPTLPDGFVGSAYYGGGYQLTATNNGSPAAITCSGASAAGLTLSSTCLLSGTPTAAGAQTIAVTFSNGTDTVTRSLTVNVSAVAIAGAGLLPNATLNKPYSYTLGASGGAGGYTYSVSGALPAGLSLSSGMISGTPTGPQGDGNFGITVSDSASHSYTRRMTIDVLGTPEAIPEIAPYGDLGDCSIGTGCSRAIGVSAGGTAPFTWRVSGLPPGMSFRSGSGATLAYVNPGDLELWGTPTALGSYSVTVEVLDANGLATTQIFPLIVSPLLVDDCLTAAGCQPAATATVGTNYANNFRVVGGTPPYTAAEPLSRAIPDGLPAGLWLGATAVSGDPGENGPFFPLLQFADAAGTPNTLTIPEAIEVNSASGSSTVINSYYPQYVTLGQHYSLTLGACCAGSYTWSVAGGTMPPGIMVSSAGVLSGIPTSLGQYFPLVEAQSGSNSGTRQIPFVITPIAVSTNSSLPSGSLNTSYSQTIAATGANGTLTWSLGPGSLLPPGLSLSSSGAITGTPAYGGAYSFSLLGTDSAGNTALPTFSMAVYTRCDFTEAGGTTVTDVQLLINQALGGAQPVDDLNLDGKVNVVDVQIGINAAVGLGCGARQPA